MNLNSACVQIKQGFGFQHQICWVLIVTVFLVLTSSARCLAQSKPFTLVGYTKGLSDGTQVKLRDMDHNLDMDSARVVNNSFTLQATQSKYDYGSHYFLFVQGLNDVISLLIENGETLEIELDSVTFPDYSIRSSTHQSAYKALDAVYYEPYVQILKYQYLLDFLQEAAQKTPRTPATEHSYEQAEIKALELKDKIHQQRSLINSAVKGSSNDFSTLFYMATYLNTLLPDTDVVQGFLRTLDANNLNTKYAKALTYYTHKNQNLFSQEVYDVNQQVSTLTKQSEKEFILVEFSSNYCAYSKEAKTDLKKVVQSYSDRLEVISILIDSDIKALENYSVLGYANWRFYYHKQAIYSPIYINFEVTATPSYYLFDSFGKLIKTWQNNQDLNGTIQSLIL